MGKKDTQEKQPNKFPLKEVALALAAFAVFGALLWVALGSEGDETSRLSQVREEKPEAEAGEPAAVAYNLKEAQAYYVDGQFEQALEALQNLEASNRYDETALNELFANTYEALGDTDAAKPYYLALAEELDQLAVTEGDIYSYGILAEKGEYYEKAGEIEQARVAYEQYLNAYEDIGIEVIPEELASTYDDVTTRYEAIR